LPENSLEAQTKKKRLQIEFGALLKRAANSRKSLLKGYLPLLGGVLAQEGKAPLGRYGETGLLPKD